MPIALDEGDIAQDVLVPRLRYCEATYGERVSWGGQGAGPRSAESQTRENTAA